MKKWCECNPRCMVRNPRQEVVHGNFSIHQSRHNCRCKECVLAYRAHVESRDFELVMEYLKREDNEKSNAGL